MISKLSLVLHLRESIFLIAIFAADPVLKAQIDNPLRSRSGLLSPESQEVFRVLTASALLIDTDLIRRDFPEETKHFATENDFKGWLLRYAAFIGAEQALQSGPASTNTEIRVGERSWALRPKEYGRSLVFDIPGGLLDSKGNGARRPKHGHESNGLETTAGAIREYLYDKAVNGILRFTEADIKGVGSYGVIDWGFDVIWPDGSRSPAGSVVRQGHERSLEGTFSGMSDEKTLRVELILRKFGITSAGAERDGRFEKLNIQGTRDGNIVDYGGFLTLKNFSREAINWDRANDPNATPQIRPGGKIWIQPDPEIRIPYEIFGSSVSGREDPAYDNVSIWSNELAQNFRQERAKLEDFKTHYENMVGGFLRKLQASSSHPIRGMANPRTCAGVALHLQAAFR